jgi:hypothetical protein
MVYLYYIGYLNKIDFDIDKDMYIDDNGNIFKLYSIVKYGKNN